MKKLLDSPLSLFVLAIGLVLAGVAIGQATQDTTPSRNRYEGTASADNALLFTAAGTDGYTVCMLESPDGAVDVEVRLGPDVAANWTTAPLSLQDLGSTSNDPVLLTAPDRMYAIVGKYDGIRVRQNGATATSAYMSCYNNGTGKRQ